jgi:hypothetical protein
MAAAVDALDEPIAAARHVSGQGEHAAESINNTVGRLTSRRAKMLDSLTAAVDEVATVHCEPVGPAERHQLPNQIAKSNLSMHCCYRLRTSRHH